MKNLINYFVLMLVSILLFSCNENTELITPDTPITKGPNKPKPTWEISGCCEVFWNIDVDSEEEAIQEIVDLVKNCGETTIFPNSTPARPIPTNAKRILGNHLFMVSGQMAQGPGAAGDAACQDFLGSYGDLASHTLDAFYCVSEVMGCQVDVDYPNGVPELVYIPHNGYLPMPVSIAPSTDDSSVGYTNEEIKVLFQCFNRGNPGFGAFSPNTFVQYYPAGLYLSGINLYCVD